jgi:hypothetical protein
MRMKNTVNGIDLLINFQLSLSSTLYLLVLLIYYFYAESFN